MDELFEKMIKAIKHLQTLHNVFKDEVNFNPDEKIDYEIYSENLEKVNNAINELGFHTQLYNHGGRQMILADLIEYFIFGRGYYSVKTKEDKKKFLELILYFVNLLMCYEVLTVSYNLRDKYLSNLEKEIKEINSEKGFSELKKFSGRVGLKKGESDASIELDKYFDSLLPKTAGGLWHELLVYIFLLRSNIGYIIPLVLSQRLLGLERNIVPPDFLIITYDKHLYGIEVGTKKEIQSGSFSLQTNIPTATIDTQNSRTSDRCPICKKWILFCPFVINNYSNLDTKIDNSEVRCLERCKYYDENRIADGQCPYTKYSRNAAQTLPHTQHEYANGLHYHYSCILSAVGEEIRKKIISAKDKIALKTHYPYYSGIEDLIKNDVK